MRGIPWQVILSAVPQKGKLCFFGILAQFIALFLPILFGMLVSGLTQGASRQRICGLVFFVILLSFMQILLFGKNEGCSITAFYEQEQRLKKLVWKRIESMSLSERDAMPPGFLMQKLSRDIVIISGTCRMLIQSGLNFIVFFFGTFLLILWKVPQLGMVFGLVVILAMLTQHIFHHQLKNSTKEMRECFYHEGNAVLNLLEMLPVLNLFGVVSLYTSLFTEKIEKTIQSQIRQQKIMLQFKILIQIELWGIQVAILATCTWLFLQNHLELGDIVMYDMLISQMLGGVSQMIFILPQLASGIEYVKSLKDLLHPSTAVIQGSDSFTRAMKKLAKFEHYTQSNLPIFVIENVTFRYADDRPPVIMDFSAVIQRGDFVCFFGRNGTGKSTLAKLLMGVYVPEKGIIYTSEAVSAMVPQNIVIYPDSLLENIRLRDVSISEKNVEEMLCKCGFQRFLQSHTGGIHTMLSPRMLSGGELQILGIVRALVRKPKVLLLDELTNNLDIVAKESVHLVLKKISDKCTVILITHDICSLELANRIFVFHPEGIAEVKEDDVEKKMAAAVQMIRRDVMI